jgi:hypothetical protein
MACLQGSVAVIVGMASLAANLGISDDALDGLPAN